MLSRFVHLTFLYGYRNVLDDELHNHFINYLNYLLPKIKRPCKSPCQLYIEITSHYKLSEYVLKINHKNKYTGTF